MLYTDDAGIASRSPASLAEVTKVMSCCVRSVWSYGDGDKDGGYAFASIGSYERR